MSVLKNCDNEIFDDMVLDVIEGIVFPSSSTIIEPLNLQSSGSSDIKIQASNGMFINFNYLASQPYDFIVLQTVSGRYVRLGAEVITGDTYDYIGTNISELRGPTIFGINNASGEWVKFESNAVKIFIGDTLRFTVDSGKISTTHTSFEVPNAFSLTNGATGDFVYFSSGSVQTFVGNTLRFDVNGSNITTSHASFVTPITFSLNNSSGESVGFTSSTVTLATDSVTRLTASSSGVTTTVPIFLPTTGGTAAGLSAYEEASTSQILYNKGTVTAATSVNATILIRLRRIGKIACMEWNFVTATKSNGTATMSLSNYTVPTSYLPLNNNFTAYSSVLYLGVYAQGTVEITTAGVINFSPTVNPSGTWVAGGFEIYKGGTCWATA